MIGVAVPEGDRRLAIKGESLYLINLTLLPGLAFLLLWRLYAGAKQSAGDFARQHLRQAFVASLWAGALLIVAVGSLVAFGDLSHPGTWIAITTYVICVHSAFVLAGVFGLARAMAGQPWRYPLVGPR